jgi:hypothetical protein
VGLAAVSEVGREAADAKWARGIAEALATEQRFTSSDLMVMYHLVAGMELPMAAGLMSQILRHLRRINRRPR